MKAIQSSYTRYYINTIDSSVMWLGLKLWVKLINLQICLLEGREMKLSNENYKSGQINGWQNTRQHIFRVFFVIRVIKGDLYRSSFCLYLLMWISNFNLLCVRWLYIYLRSVILLVYVFSLLLVLMYAFCGRMWHKNLTHFFWNHSCMVFID